MKQELKSLVLKNERLTSFVLSIRKYIQDAQVYRATVSVLDCIPQNKCAIFYIGIPAHANLGDLAQGFCVRKWLQKNYPNIFAIEIQTNALVNTRLSLLNKLKESYRLGDMIVFQSGYTTTDLGGFADEMHRAVMSALPEARMLMLPQTIFFQNEANKIRTSKCYNAMKSMLFLARDRISYTTAQQMFPDVPVKLFPDIVTTMIGKYNFDYDRNGILFCCRDDGEKLYSDAEIDDLMERCSQFGSIERTDTTIRGKTADVVKNAEAYINQEIDRYAHYRLIITDRYHGTILSLVAGTPVIILKTTDHKVTTGAEWFQGVYDDYVHVASDLDDAFRLAKETLQKSLSHKLEPYFEKEYYDKLPKLFEQVRLR